MNHTSNKWNSKILLMAILVFQFIAFITMMFDVPVARQVVGFAYFTIIPGFIIVKLLKLNQLDGLDTTLLTVGLSVAFLMIGGLLVNEIGFAFGFSEPLSSFPLLMVFNGFTLLGGLIVYFREEDVNPSESKSNFQPLSLLLLCLPILSIVGALWVNTFNGNSILLLMIVAVFSAFVLIVSKKYLPSNLYAVAVFMIAISLLYHSTLISNYIVPFGSDIPVEYYVFRTTQESGYWSPSVPYGDSVYGRYHSMLSITILPTVYSSLLNMDPTWVFKILFPLLFAIVPLGLYRLWKGYIGKKYAFIAAFLLMSQITFYTEMLGLNRQIIAELFFVLLLFVMLNKKLKPFGKSICFVIFSFGLVTSHYGLSEIFLVLLSASLILLFLLKRPCRAISVNMIVLFFVLMFIWYIYTSNGSVFSSIVQFGNYVYNQLGDFLNPSSRGQTVLMGLGLSSSPTLWNTLSRAFAYATEGLIVIGFIGLITKRVKNRFDNLYLILSFIAMGFLAALIIVPGLANTMNMTRFYHILLFFLAPLCVIGTTVIANFLSKPRKKLLISVLLVIVIVPYFMFQTGFVYELTSGETTSLSLSKYRMDASLLYGNFGYMDDCSVFGAKWISENVDLEQSKLYADSVSQNAILTSYGMVYRGYVSPLSNITNVANNGTVYLSTLNVVYGKILYYGKTWNTSDVSYIFDNLNKVYANGASEIYMGSPNTP